MEPALAEALGTIAFNTFKALVGSELFAQATCGATEKEADEITKSLLIKALIEEEVPKLAPRIDAKHRSAADTTSGAYMFADDNPDAIKNATYNQALEALKFLVPHEGRKLFKRLHAEGASPYDAYMRVMEWRAETFGEDGAAPETQPDEVPSTITDGLARQQLATAPPKVQAAYREAYKAGETARSAMERALDLWRQIQEREGYPDDDGDGRRKAG
jgi:hypothetical protein